MISLNMISIASYVLGGTPSSTNFKKSSWKFCPECGVEITQETYEDQLSKLSKEELIELLKNK